MGLVSFSLALNELDCLTRKELYAEIARLNNRISEKREPIGIVKEVIAGSCAYIPCVEFSTNYIPKVGDKFFTQPKPPANEEV